MWYGDLHLSFHSLPLPHSVHHNACFWYWSGCEQELSIHPPKLIFGNKMHFFHFLFVWRDWAGKSTVSTDQVEMDPWRGKKSLSSALNSVSNASQVQYDFVLTVNQLNKWTQSWCAHAFKYNFEKNTLFFRAGFVILCVYRRLRFPNPTDIEHFGLAFTNDQSLFALTEMQQTTHNKSRWMSFRQREALQHCLSSWAVLSLQAQVLLLSMSC